MRMGSGTNARRATSFDTDVVVEVGPMYFKTSPAYLQDWRVRGCAIRETRKLVKDDVSNLVCKFSQTEPAAAFQVGKNHDRDVFARQNPKI